MQAVIDLGEDWAPPAATDEPPRRISLRVPLALLSLVLVAMLGGAAVPRYAMTSMFSVPLGIGGAYAIGTDAVYTAHDGEVIGYRLPDGARQWSVEIGQSVSTLRPMPEAGVVLAEYGITGNVWSGLVALDARTGRALWEDSRARVRGTPDPHRVVLSTFDETSSDSGAVSLSEGVRGVEAATGRTIWSRQASPGSWTVSDAPAAPRAVVGTDDGMVEVLDAATGATVTRGRLRASTGSAPGDVPGGPGAVSSNGAISVQVDAATGEVVSIANIRSIVGDRLLSAGWDRTGDLLDAYELPSLAPLWSARLQIQALSVDDCGTVLCANAYDSVAGIDPRTGTVAWSSSTLRWAYPLPGGRLFAISANDALPPTVLDAASSRTLLTLTGWRLVGGFGDRTLLARDDATGLHTWFAELDPASLRLHPLGWASGVPIDECGHSDTYLACPTVKNQLHLWRLRDLP